MVKSTSSPGPGTAIDRHAILGRQRVHELLRAVHRAARGAGANVALIDQQDDQASARRAFGVGRGEGFVGHDHLGGGADHAERIGRADVFDRRDLTLGAVDLDLQLRGGEVGDLTAVVVERRDVDGDEFDAGSKNRCLGCLGPGCLGPGAGAAGSGAELRRWLRREEPLA